MGGILGLSANNSIMRYVHVSKEALSVVASKNRTSRENTDIRSMPSGKREFKTVLAEKNEALIFA